MLTDTPSKLIDYVSKVKDNLRLPNNDRNEVHWESNVRLYRRSIPGYIYLLNFIMNRVPSDIYRIKNPKLEISQDVRGGSGGQTYTVKQVVKDDFKPSSLDLPEI